MSILDAIQAMSAVMLLAFVLVFGAAAVTTAILEAKDRRKLRRQRGGGQYLQTGQT